MKARSSPAKSKPSDSSSYISHPIRIKNQEQLSDPSKSSLESLSAECRQEDSGFESSSQAESYGEYKKDGYHPVYIGECYCNKKYHVIQKLGWGTFSTVWLVKNTENHQFYAMKVQKSKKSIKEMAIDEIQILKELLRKTYNSQWLQWKEKFLIDQPENYCIQIMDNFPQFGIHGLHYCSVFEIVGPTLLNLIQNFEAKDTQMSMQLVKLITKQILIGLVYIHDFCKIIHTDIKPENIMIQLSEDQRKQLITLLENSSKTPLSQKFIEKNKKNYKSLMKIKVEEKNNKQLVHTQQGLVQDQENLEVDIFRWKEQIEIKLNQDLKVKIVDFGNGCWTFKHFTNNIQTKEYRAPEAIIGSPYNEKIDIWSLGCLIFEMATNNYLFKPTSGDSFNEDEDPLAMIIQTFGPFTTKFALSGIHSKKFFDLNCQLKNINEILDNIPLEKILINEYNFDLQVAINMCDYLKFIMQTDPSKRPSAREALNHPWIQD